MKYAPSEALARLPSACDKPRSEYPADCDDSGPLIYDEEAFKRILVLERKRSERSRRPFILMLVPLDGISTDRAGGDIREKVFSCLAATKRDIDVLGWYRQDAVVGMIFTEISDSSRWSLFEPIARRIEANLATGLGADGAKMVPISFSLFPEKPRPLAASDLLTLYPDIKERLDSHKKSLFVKRLIDVCGAMAGLVLFSPVFVLLAALIKLTTKGPVFFRQERVGQYGRTFTFLKFRSMYVDNDPSIHREYTKRLILAGGDGAGEPAQRKSGVFKICNDPRVTPLGRFLRKSSLDELPQLMNVLAGNMSLVGPRPPIPYELENYALWHRRRVFEMKPGMTGLWQVEGRSRTTFDEMVRLDIQYMTHWSLWLDLLLILKTPLAVFGAGGAY